jgi:hypothetical protein
VIGRFRNRLANVREWRRIVENDAVVVLFHVTSIGLSVRRAAPEPAQSKPHQTVQKP